MSLGGPSNPGTLATAVAAAIAAGHVLVASMGNAASGSPFYPAAYANVVYGYDDQPSQTAVSYYVTAVAEGVETVYYQYMTYLPVGTPVC